MAPRSKIPVNIRNTQLLRSMAKRRGIQLRTTSRVQQSRSEILENPSDAQGGRMSQERGEHISQPVTNKDPGIPQLDDVMKPSTDLSWHPGIQRWWWRIRGKYRLYQRSLFPKLTQDQRETIAWEKLEKEKDRICKREARGLIKVITPAMFRIGNMNQSDRIRWLGFTRDESFTKIFLILDASTFYTSQLRDPRWTDELTLLIRLPVRWDVGIHGAILEIDRMGADAPKRRVITVENLLEE